MDFRVMGKSLKSEFNSFLKKVGNKDNQISKETFLEVEIKLILRRLLN